MKYKTAVNKRMEMKKICLFLCFSGFCLSLCGQHIYPFQGKNGKFGLANCKYREFDEPQEKVIVKPKYDSCYYSWDNEIATVKLNNKWGFIDNKGKKITPIKYDFARSFNDGHAIVKLNGKWGYVDTNGKEKILLGNYDDIGISVKYISIDEFSEPDFEINSVFIGNLIAATVNRKFGLIDTNENIIVPYKYNEIGISYGDDILPVRSGDKWGAINSEGEEIIPCEYDFPEIMGEIEEFLEKNEIQNRR